MCSHALPPTLLLQPARRSVAVRAAGWDLSAEVPAHLAGRKDLAGSELPPPLPAARRARELRPAAQAAIRGAGSAWPCWAGSADTVWLHSRRGRHRRPPRPRQRSFPALRRPSPPHPALCCPFLISIRLWLRPPEPGQEPRGPQVVPAGGAAERPLGDAGRGRHPGPGAAHVRFTFEWMLLLRAAAERRCCRVALLLSGAACLERSATVAASICAAGSVSRAAHRAAPRARPPARPQELLHSTHLGGKAADVYWFDAGNNTFWAPKVRLCGALQATLPSPGRQQRAGTEGIQRAPDARPAAGVCSGHAAVGQHMAVAAVDHHGKPQPHPALDC